MKKLNKVFGMTKTRESKLNIITEKLTRELTNMDEYLNGMSNAQPALLDLDEITRELMAIDEASKKTDRTPTVGENRSVRSSMRTRTPEADREDQFYLIPYFFTTA